VGRTLEVEGTGDFDLRGETVDLPSSLVGAVFAGGLDAFVIKTLPIALGAASSFTVDGPAVAGSCLLTGAAVRLVATTDAPYFLSRAFTSVLSAWGGAGGVLSRGGAEVLGVIWMLDTTLGTDNAAGSRRGSLISTFPSFLPRWTGTVSGA
jgi:hypothetical protein